MAKSFKQWLDEGEELYGEALREYEALEAHLEELEQKLAAKKEELDQIARVIGKPPVESRRRPAVQVVEAAAPGSIPASRNTIAKALTGRGLS